MNKQIGISILLLFIPAIAVLSAGGGREQDEQAPMEVKIFHCSG